MSKTFLTIFFDRLISSQNVNVDHQGEYGISGI